ncbi:MAG: SNF2-related protein [Erysipelotrichaceae bacterium]
MMNISINSIEKLAPYPFEFNEALDYYREDLASEIKITKQANDNIAITATFANRYYFGNEKTTHLLYNPKENSLEFSCNCSFRYQGNLCSHTLAVLIYLLDFDLNNLPISYQGNFKTVTRSERKKRVEYLYDCLAREHQIETSRTILNTIQNNLSQKSYQPLNNSSSLVTVLVELNDCKDYYGDHYLSFKVGDNRAYSIKNISSFLNNIDQNKTARYGKNFCFNHNIDNFDTNGKAAIALMRNLISRLQPPVKGNKLILDDNNIAALADYLNLTDAKSSNMIYQLAEEPIVFNVRKQGEDCFIDYPTVTEGEQLYYCDGDIYYLAKSDNTFVLKKKEIKNKTVFETLFEQLMEHNSLRIGAGQIEAFYKLVVAPLKQSAIFADYPYDESNIDVETTATLKGYINDDDLIEFNLTSQFSSGKQENSFLQQKDLSLLTNKIKNTLLNYGNKNENNNIVMEIDNDKTREFITAILPQIKNDIDVYLSDEIFNFGKKQKYSFSVGISFKNDLLALDISSDQIPVDELADVIKAYQKKKKFYKLKDGQNISLYSDQLEQLNDFIESYGISPKQLADNNIQINKYRAMSLAKEDFDGIKFERSQKYSQFLENFASLNDDDFQISEKFHNILRNYQTYGVNWLHHLKKLSFGSILADDMGLGKTLEIIALLESEKAGLSIVICPTSLVLNWEDEIKKFKSSLKAAAIYGSKENRQSIITDHQNYDLLITSYDYLRNDIDLYQNIQFDTIVLDEAQFIKNQTTKNSIAVKQLNGKHKIALTGTPIENSLAELWSIFDFIMPGYLYNYNYFKNHFEKDVVNNRDEKVTTKLQKMISPFILRRNKKDVLQELPEKQTHTILVDFAYQERKIYLANLLQAKKQLTENEKVDKIALLAQITKLRQICSDCRLVYDNYFEPSSKLTACVELIQTLKDNGKKVLVFSSFTKLFPLLIELLEENGISYFVLTGQNNKESRKELVDRFQLGQADVFLISLKAGGTGLNLTKAEAVIHLNPWWNISAENQATDRAHRIGQHNNVLVYKMIMKNSIEERIIQLQEMKKELTDTFIENNSSNAMKMTKEDFEKLFTD